MRITKQEAVRLLSAIVDCEWAAMWGDEEDVGELVDLAKGLEHDAALEEDAAQQHRLTHEAGALRLVAALLGEEPGAQPSYHIEGRLTYGGRLVLSGGARVDVFGLLVALQPEGGLDIEEGAPVRFTLARLAKEAP